MPIREPSLPPRDPVAIALDTLVWLLGEPTRADRLLAATGLDAATLRARLDDPATLAGVLQFVEAHEPDLIAAARALALDPAAIVAASRSLSS